MVHAIEPNTYSTRSEQPGPLAALRRRLADRQGSRATYRALNDLSDRRLADIGLARADLHKLAFDSHAGGSQQTHLHEHRF